MCTVAYRRWSSRARLLLRLEKKRWNIAIRCLRRLDCVCRHHLALLTLLDLSLLLPLVDKAVKEAITTMVVGEAATSLGHHATIGVRGGRCVMVLEEVVAVAIVISARSTTSSGRILGLPCRRWCWRRPWWSRCCPPRPRATACARKSLVLILTGAIERGISSSSPQLPDLCTPEISSPSDRNLSILCLLSWVVQRGPLERVQEEPEHDEQRLMLDVPP
jgi:hypothetical protein